jgi:hypothetical protein
VEPEGQQLLDQGQGQLRLGLEAVTGLEARLGFVEGKSEGKGDLVQHPIGIDRDQALLHSMQPSQVLGRRIVGGVPLLAVAGLINTEHQGPPNQSLTGELQPNGAQLLHRPFGVGQEMMQRLMVALHGLGQARQRLALRLRQHPQFQLGELLEMAHVVRTPNGSERNTHRYTPPWAWRLVFSS